MKTLEYYNEIAVKARNMVRDKYKGSPIAYKSSHNLKTMRGYCADVAQHVIILLDNDGVDSYLLNVHNPSFDGFNHIAVYVPSDNVIIDGTINQYVKTDNYAYKKDLYPLKQFVVKNV